MHFSSPELKASVSFSDCLLSRLTVRELFTFSSSSLEPLGQFHDIFSCLWYTRSFAQMYLLIGTLFGEWCGPWTSCYWKCCFPSANQKHPLEFHCLYLNPSAYWSSQFKTYKNQNKSPLEFIVYFDILNCFSKLKYKWRKLLHV